MTLCRACDESFAGTKAFDRHRTGDHGFTFAEGLSLSPARHDGRRCRSAAEMTEHGMTPNRAGAWTITANAEWARKRWSAPDRRRGSL